MREIGCAEWETWPSGGTRRGEAERAKSFFAECLRTANQLTDKTDTGRGFFAASLAVVNVPAALAIAKDFAGDRTHGRILGNIALRVVEGDPAEVERIWKEFPAMAYLGEQAATLCWKMARVDPARARRVTERIPWIERHPEAFFSLALGSRERDESAARQALDEGCGESTSSCGSGPNTTNSSPDRSSQSSNGSTRCECRRSSGAMWPRGPRSAIRARSAPISRAL
jgi:hypothetical protein